MATGICNDALHRAAYYGNIDRVRQLLGDGEDINGQNKSGKTPLMMALLGDAKKKVKFEMINVLLDRGADASIVNKDGDSLLHVAVKASMHRDISKKFVKSLLEYGADNTMINAGGKTASKLAYEIGSVKLGDFLLFYEPEPIIEQKSSHVMNELLSCLFPTYAFHRQFREDMEFAVQQERMNRLLDREKSGQVEIAKALDTSAEKETACDHENETACGHGNDVSVPGKVVIDVIDTTEINNTETETEIMTTDLKDVEKVQICSNKNTTIPETSYLPETTKDFPVCDSITRHSHIHQLSHIGNEVKTVRKNDEKIHQLRHIGNESNFNDAMSRNFTYVYA